MYIYSIHVLVYIYSTSINLHACLWYLCKASLARKSHDTKNINI